MEENISPKEQYDLQKKEKQNKSINKKPPMSKSKIIWFLVIIGVVIFIIWIASQPKVEKVEPVLLEGVTELGEVIPIQQASHIGTKEDHAEYNSNPPTSGPHFANVLAAGFYKKPLEDEAVIHGLEHGNIWISYTSAVDEETVKLLREVYRQNSRRVIVSPREENDSPIVLVSWGRKLELDIYDESIIYTYIELHTNESPEPFAK